MADLYALTFDKDRNVILLPIEDKVYDQHGFYYLTKSKNVPMILPFNGYTIIKL